MSLSKRGGFAARLWILCIICSVFAGICFDNVRADSCLAYQNAGEMPLISEDSDNLCNSYNEAAVSLTLLGAERGIPSGQAYVPEGSVQGGYALIPRKTTQRAGARNALYSVFFILVGAILFSTDFCRRRTFFSDGLCEIISNTVILRYIHGQDGEKA